MTKKPLILENSTVCFDCCDTLVFYEYPSDYPGEVKVITYQQYRSPYPGKRRMAINTAAVEALKEHKKRGDSVVVWSAGGWRWAKGIIESLNLEEYVDIIMDKPSKLYDDLTPFHPDMPTGWLPSPELPLPKGWKRNTIHGSPYFSAKCMKGQTCEKCDKGKYKHFKTELNKSHKLYCTVCNYVIDKWNYGE